MKLMLVKNTITLHKDYIAAILASELSFEKALILLSKYQGKGFSSLFPKELKDELIAEDYLKDSGMLSTKGRDYIISIMEQDISEEADKRLETDFNEFWDAFPSTDKIYHFPATRSLKDNKQRCKQEYSTLISDGYTAHQILSGLKKQLDSIRDNSIRENRLTYMKNSLRWLRDKDFLNWENQDTNDIYKPDLDVF